MKRFSSGKGKPRKRPFSKGAPKHRPKGRFRILEPQSWSPKGEAVYQDGEHRVLIWSGIPQEKAKHRLVHRGENQTLMEYVKANKPHRSRIEPSCTHYTPCGGCPLMHMNQEGQKAAKLSLLQQRLSSVGLEKYAPGDIFSMEKEQYRHQIKLVVTEEKGAMKNGVRNRRNQVAPIPNCEVVTTQLKLVAKKLAHALIRRSNGPQDKRIFAYSAENPTGLRYIVARQSSHTGNILLCFVATHKHPGYDELADWLLDMPLPVTGISIHINKEEGNAIFSRSLKGDIRSEILRGSKTIQERSNGLIYRIGVGDFFQVNPRVAAQLQRDLLRVAEPYKDQSMVDLYCGVGYFSLMLARSFGKVMGIEGIGGAIERAKDNALLNGVKADFFAGRVEELLEKKVMRLESPFVVVDPARRGLEEGVTEQISRLLPSALVYISCSPKSLAQDLAAFQELGWNIQSIQAYDMIPQSAHIEMMAFLLPANILKTKYRKPRRQIIR